MEQVDHWHVSGSIWNTSPKLKYVGGRALEVCMKMRAVVAMEAFGADEVTGIAYDYGADAGLGVFGGGATNLRPAKCRYLGGR